MAYVEWHDTIRSHYKTDALMRALSIKRREAVGIIGCLSSWAIQFRPGGVLERHLVQIAVDWDGDGEVLVRALVGSGWVDECDGGSVMIHDWADITRGYRKARQDCADRKIRSKTNIQRDCSATVALQQRDNSATTALQHRDCSASVVPNERTNEQNERAERTSRTNEQSERANGGADAPNAHARGEVLPTWAVRLVQHWNSQPARSPISLEKGARHVETAHAAGLSKQEIEALVWDQSACAGRKLYEVLDSAVCGRKTEIRRTKNGPPKI